MKLWVTHDLFYRTLELSDLKVDWQERIGRYKINKVSRNILN